MAAIRRGQVVVITGASSGIGRAVAHEFAKAGARIVLIARDSDHLLEVMHEVHDLGGECLSFPADTADAPAMEMAAWEAVKLWGRLDVWVNNAGVGVLGSFTDVPWQEHRRVIETNLIGYMNGAHAALKVFKRQGFGTVINNASVCSRLAPPHLASYNASKFGIRGLTHSLRQDLALEGFKNIHVCQVNPGVIDTPAFASAANHSGHDIPKRVPMSKPLDVARAIVDLCAHPRREVFVGNFARLGSFMYTLLPALTAAVLVFATRRYYRLNGPSRPESSGNLFVPVHNQ